MVKELVLLKKFETIVYTTRSGSRVRSTLQLGVVWETLQEPEEEYALLFHSV